MYIKILYEETLEFVRDDGIKFLQKRFISCRDIKSIYIYIYMCVCVCVTSVILPICMSFFETIEV